MHQGPLFAVLLAGGSGTRFWPASRKTLPKQFLRVTGGRTMLRATYERIAALVPPERVLVVTGAEQVALVGAELPELPPANVLGEPLGRNTLAAIALASEQIAQRAPDSVQMVLPADHVIEPQERLQASLASAVGLAREEDVLVLFGIRPTEPATAYGYVEIDPEPTTGGKERALRVLRFVEKPDPERARQFLASGRFLWNSGIFVWGTRAIRRSIEEHAPGIAGALAGARPEELARIYPGLPSLPVDVAVLERATNVRVLPIDYRWSDVGSWPALAEVLAGDPAGNVRSGSGALIVEDSEGCIVHSDEGSLVALIGVHDLVVVQAGGATLVCPRERAQDVRKIVAELEQRDPRWL